MLSMGHVLIPQSDLRWSKQTDVAGQYFNFFVQPKLANSRLMISHSFPCGYDPWGGSTHSQPLPLPPTLGVRVPGFCSCLVWVLNEEKGSQCPKSSPHSWGSWRQLGPRYSSNQYLISEGSTHVSNADVDCLSLKYLSAIVWLTTEDGASALTGSNISSWNSEYNVAVCFFTLSDKQN